MKLDMTDSTITTWWHMTKVDLTVRLKENLLVSKILYSDRGPPVIWYTVETWSISILMKLQKYVEKTTSLSNGLLLLIEALQAYLQ